MREFAKAFYESPAWRRTRAYILKRDAGLCVHCGEPGVIVHHKIELTPRNIDDPAIALGEDNLETVCRTCHALIHEGTPPLADGLAFDADGNIISYLKFNELNFNSNPEIKKYNPDKYTDYEIIDKSHPKHE